MKVYKIGKFTYHPFDNQNISQQQFIDEICDENDEVEYIGRLKYFFYTFDYKDSFWDNRFIVEFNKNLIGYIHVSNSLYPFLNYAVHPKFRGKSYGTKILSATSDYIFSNYPEVYNISLTIVPENEHSINTALKAGYIQEDDTSYYKTK